MKIATFLLLCLAFIFVVEIVLTSAQIYRPYYDYPHPIPQFVIPYRYGYYLGFR